MHELRKFIFLRYFILFSAPGSYDIEKSEKTVHQSSSAYSFGVKYKEHRTEDIPGKFYF